MARPGVTYQAVANAAELLVTQQQTPTLDRIRAILGTGSNTTLAQHFKLWKLTKKSPVDLPQSNELPDELINSLKSLWERLTTIAEEKINQLHKQHDAELNHLSSQIDKYKSNNLRWQKLYEGWIEEKKADTAEISRIKKDNSALETKCASLSQTAADKQARIEELHRLHQQTQLNLEHFRNTTRKQQQMDHEKHSQLQHQAELIIKELRDDKEHASNSIAALQQTLAQSSAQLCVTKTSNTHLTQTNAHLLQSNSELQKHCADYEFAKNHWQEQMLKLETEVLSQREKQLDLEKNYAKLLQMFSMANEQLEQLSIENSSLTAEKWSLAQENSQLQGQLKQLVSA